jgi:hypothetical protein
MRKVRSPLEQSSSYILSKYVCIQPDAFAPGNISLELIRYLNRVGQTAAMSRYLGLMPEINMFDED